MKIDMDVTRNIPIFYCDKLRHLVCLPYNVDNLHQMAQNLGINKCWFHHNHYDIPVTRVEEIMVKCTIVRPRQIMEIIQTGKINL